MISTKLNFNRRAWLAALALTCTISMGLFVDSASAKPLGTAAVLGDGYAQKLNEGVPTWSTQLDSQGVLDVTSNLAKERALASGASGPLSLLGQVDAYLAAAKTKLARYTFVYIGNADILLNQNLATAKANYAKAVDKLVAAGANAGSNRLVLVRLHDLSTNPGVSKNIRKKVVDYNKNIQSVAGSRPNVLQVNLGQLIDDVLKNPAKYGLTNVTTPNRTKSKTTALYYDNTHFGQKGHAIIAAEVKKVLSPPAN